MNDIQLAKAWSTIGLFLLVFSLDSWLRTQGLSPIFGSHLPHTERTAAALLGVIINVIAAALLLRIAFSFTRRQPSGKLAARLPIAFYVSLETADKNAVSFQRIMYFLFHIFPLFAIFHFLKIVLSSQYYMSAECDNLQCKGVSLWQWPDPYIWDNGFRLDNCNGVTFFPVLEPVLLVAVVSILVAWNVRYFFLLRS